MMRVGAPTPAVTSSIVCPRAMVGGAAGGGAMGAAAASAGTGAGPRWLPPARPGRQPGSAGRSRRRRWYRVAERRGERCLDRGRLSGWRRGGQSTLALFGLQIAHALVDGFAHVILHVLQIVEGYGDVVGFHALLPAFAGEHDGGGPGASAGGAEVTSRMSPWLMGHSCPAASTRSRSEPAMKTWG